MLSLKNVSVNLLLLILVSCGGESAPIENQPEEKVDDLLVVKECELYNKEVDGDSMNFIKKENEDGIVEEIAVDYTDNYGDYFLNKDALTGCTKLIIEDDEKIAWYVEDDDNRADIIKQFDSIIQIQTNAEINLRFIDGVESLVLFPSLEEITTKQESFNDKDFGIGIYLRRIRESAKISILPSLKIAAGNINVELNLDEESKKSDVKIAENLIVANSVDLEIINYFSGNDNYIIGDINASGENPRISAFEKMRSDYENSTELTPLQKQEFALSDDGRYVYLYIFENGAYHNYVGEKLKIEGTAFNKSYLDAVRALDNDGNDASVNLDTQYAPFTNHEHFTRHFPPNNY